jgi:hypothetical protein
MAGNSAFAGSIRCRDFGRPDDAKLHGFAGNQFQGFVRFDQQWQADINVFGICQR